MANFCCSDEDLKVEQENSSGSSAPPAQKEESSPFSIPTEEDTPSTPPMEEYIPPRPGQNNESFSVGSSGSDENAGKSKPSVVIDLSEGAQT